MFVAAAVNARRLAVVFLPGVAIAVVCGGSCPAAQATSFGAAVDSPACAAAKQRIEFDNRMIARLAAQLPNRHADIQPVRARQINTQIAHLQADLAKAEAAQAKECATPISEYNGLYNGTFGSIGISFTVANGVISGDIVNPTPLLGLDPKTGIAHAQANFVGADCHTFEIHFDPAAGTAAVQNLTCTLLGQTLTQTVVARRKG